MPLLYLQPEFLERLPLLRPRTFPVLFLMLHHPVPEISSILLVLPTLGPPVTIGGGRLLSLQQTVEYSAISVLNATV